MLGNKADSSFACSRKTSSRWCKLALVIVSCVVKRLEAIKKQSRSRIKPFLSVSAMWVCPSTLETKKDFSKLAAWLRFKCLSHQHLGPQILIPTIPITQRPYMGLPEYPSHFSPDWLDSQNFFICAKTIISPLHHIRPSTKNSIAHSIAKRQYVKLHDLCLIIWAPPKHGFDRLMKTRFFCQISQCIFMISSWLTRFFEKNLLTYLSGLIRNVQTLPFIKESLIWKVFVFFSQISKSIPSWSGSRIIDFILDFKFESQIKD